MTERYSNALDAFKGRRFQSVLQTLVCVSALENERDHGKPMVISGEDALWSLLGGDVGGELTRTALASYDPATLDAVMVVMYAGRDGDYALPESGRYDRDRIDAEFADWWDYLRMDSEPYVLAMLCEKKPLDRYLRKGARMFRVDER